eukprot:IDg8546t1
MLSTICEPSTYVKLADPMRDQYRRLAMILNDGGYKRAHRVTGRASLFPDLNCDYTTAFKEESWNANSRVVGALRLPVQI